MPYQAALTQTTKHTRLISLGRGLNFTQALDRDWGMLSWKGPMPENSLTYQCRQWCGEEMAEGPNRKVAEDQAPPGKFIGRTSPFIHWWHGWQLCRLWTVKWTHRRNEAWGSMLSQESRTSQGRRLLKLNSVSLLLGINRNSLWRSPERQSIFCLLRVWKVFCSDVIRTEP